MVTFTESLIVCVLLTDVVGGETGERAIRLIRNGLYSQSWNSGIVQIYYKGSWGNICEDYSFALDEATVICHQLAYTGAYTYSTTSAVITYGSDFNGTAVEDLFCWYSSYLSLSQCSLSGQYSSYCSSDSHDLVITCYSTRIWNSPYNGQIRLTGGEYSNQGLLEVYCNGQWGTVCNNGFGSTDARVACRQLGYRSYYNYDHLSVTGNNLANIWLTYVSCSSSDECLVDQCKSCPSLKVTSCTHSEDVTLDCGYSANISSSSTKKDDCEPAVETGERALRLVRNGVPSQSWNSGIVQIYHKSSWGNICEDSSFAMDEANVICHQLAYTGASNYTTTTYTSLFGVDLNSTAVEDLSCTYSTYLSISQCSLSSQYSSYCSSNNRDLVVTCYSSRIWDSPYPGQIRLTAGEYSNQGLLEVYCNGQWGTVCDNGFGSTDARVACRQLGYDSYHNYDHLSITGSILKSIWLTYVYCLSSDKCLVDQCKSCPSSKVTSCYHSEDVTLDCGYYAIISSSSVKVDDCEPTVTETGERALRLLRNGIISQSWSSGIVQIYHQGTWGNICEDSYFDSIEADVICHQLAFTGSSSYFKSAIFGSDFNDTAVEDVSCSYSTYLSLSQCTLSSQYSSYCSSNNNDLVITCYVSRIWDNPYSGQIRLTGGNYSNQGLLEVYCNGQWGTVCDNGFGSTDARVTCRQLGYKSYYSYDRLTIMGNSSQNIWLTYVSCSSYSRCLDDCNSCPHSAITSCTHSEDITLDCGYFSTRTISSVRIGTCANGKSDSTGSSSATVGGGSGGVAVGSCLVCFCLLFCGLRYRSKSDLSRRSPTTVVTTSATRVTTSTLTVQTPQQRTISTNSHPVGFQYTVKKHKAPHPPPYAASATPSAAPNTFIEQPPPSYNKLFQDESHL